MKCPRCGQDNPQNADRCRFCGVALRGEPQSGAKKDSNALLAVILVLAAVFLVIIGILVYQAMPHRGHSFHGGGGGGGAISTPVFPSQETDDGDAADNSDSGDDAADSTDDSTTDNGAGSGNTNDNANGGSQSAAQQTPNVTVVEARRADNTRTLPPEEASLYGRDTRTDVIRIPAISGVNTSVVSSINSRIAALGDKVIDASNDPQYSNYLFDFTYSYSIRNGIVALVTEMQTGIICSEYWNNYTAFYYDAASDRELSLNEYLNVMGVTVSQIKTAARNKTGCDVRSIEGVEIFDGKTIVACTFVDEGDLVFGEKVELPSLVR